MALRGILELLSAAMQADAVQKAADIEQDIYRQNEQTADFNAATMRASYLREAKLDEIRAQQSEEIGRFQQSKVRQYGAQVRGAQRAAAAASGIDSGFGSAANAVAATDVMTEMDVQTVAANAMRESWGYKVRADTLRIGAQNVRSEADDIRLRAKLARMKSNNQIGSLLLEGIAAPVLDIADTSLAAFGMFGPNVGDVGGLLMAGKNKPGIFDMAAGKFRGIF